MAIKRYWTPAETNGELRHSEQIETQLAVISVVLRCLVTAPRTWMHIYANIESVNPPYYDYVKEAITCRALIC